MPASPAFGLAIVAEEIAAVPAGNPERAAAVAPDTPGALTRHWRLQDRDGVGLGIDLAEIIAGERGEEHLAIRRRGDAVGAGATRCIEHRHPAGFGIEPALDAILPGEPQHALAIETRRVEVGVPPLLEQRKELRCARRGIDPRDRVLPAFGDPGGPVRSADPTMGPARQ